MQPADGFKRPKRSQLDWRGWIALFWVLSWALVYGVKMLQARGVHISF